MGAGKSTVRDALVSQGLPFIDLDQVGHDVLKLDVVKEELVEAFGRSILDNSGEIIRQELANKAFLSPADTRKLNRITMPRIEEAFGMLLDSYKVQGVPAVVIEYSVFKDKVSSLAWNADVIIAVVAPIDERIKRAVGAGFQEEDVLRRIAAQITDADRIDAADVVLKNDSSKQDLYNLAVDWWDTYKSTGIINS